MLKRKIKANDIKSDIEDECRKEHSAEIHKLAKTYLTVEHVRELLHFKSKQSIRNLVYKGKLKAIRISGKLLFRKNDIMRLIKR